MQCELFGQPATILAGQLTSAEHFTAIVRRMGTIPEFSPLRVWFIGSVLRKMSKAQDLDILFTRRDNRRLMIGEIEEALCAARRIGLQEFGISIDPCFRNLSSDALAGTLQYGDMFLTWKLESPFIANAIRRGLPAQVIRCGRFLAVFRIEVEYTGYFMKLPHCRGTGALEERFLQPGVSLETCLRYYTAKGKGWPPGFGA